MAKGELQVKNECFTHNRSVSATAFATYPTSRGLSDPIITARVDGMLAVGAKRSRIYDYLLERDQNVIQADNRVRNHAASPTSNVDDNEATTQEIAQFAAAESENVFTIAETEAGESE
ncbi:hypothetical protein GN958_ATG09576 [Phytophthora infestans]|uniref:Uncharacterized protein n=1 Tax=Phytophthora infestans TaxID=4787 RepID=A0A8S9UL43_PHYIN|nr:hypothetical protein GN958_ATG09576 [Phytophthora infestans]